MKRVPLQRRTPLRAKSPQRRTAKPGQRRPPKPGFSDDTKATIRARSRGRCEISTDGCTQRAVHFHHRKLRRHGDHSVVNGLHVCSSCHDYAHANPDIAMTMGWIVASWLEPGEVRMLRGGG